MSGGADRHTLGFDYVNGRVTSGKAFEVEHTPEEALRAQEAAAAYSLQQAFAALPPFALPL